MKILNIILILGILGGFFLAGTQMSGTSPSSTFTKLEVMLGHEGVDLLRYPDKVTLEGKDLSKEQVKALQNLLLNDAGYIWDFKKRCVFIPETKVEFIKTEEISVIFSFSCMQVKFQHGEKSFILDIDPMSAKIKEIL